MYHKDLKHINPQDLIAFDWEKFHNDNRIAPKPDCPVSYKQSAVTLAIAAAEKALVAKRTAEEAFDKVYSLKKSIREFDGNFNFLNLLFY